MQSNYINTKVRTIVLVGATGAGKSTTGNMLYNGITDRPFIVCDDAVSCTFSIDQQTNFLKKLRLVDTPGFGDNRFSEREIDKVLRDLTSIIAHPSVESTGTIDAFLLPVKFNPRPSTLKNDLEHILDLFGSAALKTLIILPIFLDDKDRTETSVMNILSGMGEVVKMLKEGKNEELNNNWFCLWDNFKPKLYQEENLMNKIKTLKPYTHHMFLEAQAQVQRSLDDEVKKKVEPLMFQLKQDIAGQTQEIQERIRMAELSAFQERIRIQEAQQKEQEEKARLAALIKQKEEEHQAAMARVRAQFLKCTLETGGRTYTHQNAYSCNTCNIVGTLMLCSNCVDTCHKGHSVTYRGILYGFCDCRYNTLNCQLQNICTYKLSGKGLILQLRFTCDTCKMNPTKGEMMCQYCAKVCHQSKGHQIRYLGLCHGYCDCSFMYHFCCARQ